jgi:hypothetical protein
MQSAWSIAEAGRGIASSPWRLVALGAVALVACGSSSRTAPPSAQNVPPVGDPPSPVPPVGDPPAPQTPAPQPPGPTPVPQPPPVPQPIPPEPPLPSGSPQPAAPLPPGYRLVWQDEFNGAAVDPTRWHVFAWDRGDARDTPAAVTVAGGVLRITTSTEGGVHETGFLSTEYGLFEATRGYFEARIRFHAAPGQWCAFWLTTPTIGNPRGDPARAGAEIDVVEHRLLDESGWQLADWVGQNVIWDGYNVGRQNDHHVSPLPDAAPVNGAWHTFAVRWDETAYVFYVDAAEMWRTSAGLSSRSEYMLLTCEVLDHDWAGNIPATGYGPRATSTSGMEVDWVRVWQKGP